MMGFISDCIKSIESLRRINILILSNLSIHEHDIYSPYLLFLIFWFQNTGFTCIFCFFSQQFYQNTIHMPACCCSVAKSCLTLGDRMDCSTPGPSVFHHLPEFVQTHVHRVSDAIQPSHLLLSPSPPAFSLSQHQDLFQWVSSSHQVAKELELQHQSFQWISRVDFL